MSQYDKLDGDILDAIKEDGAIDYMNLFCDVRKDCARLSLELNREQLTVLDSRLQALRKRGLIAYIKGKWRLTNEVTK